MFEWLTGWMWATVVAMVVVYFALGLASVALSSRVFFHWPRIGQRGWVVAEFFGGAITFVLLPLAYVGRSIGWFFFHLGEIGELVGKIARIKEV